MGGRKLHTIALDIETVAEDKLEVPAIVAPTNYKDPEKIERYIAEKEQDFHNKAALNPNTGKIVCICICYEKEDCEDLSYRFYAGEEKDILKSFWEEIAKVTEFITFNGKLFDVPFIIKRSWYHNIVPSKGISTKLYGDSNHIDLRLALSFGDKNAKGSLEFYAKKKLDYDLVGTGSMVSQWWKEKDIERIVSHCTADVYAAYQLYKSMRGYYF